MRWISDLGRNQRCPAPIPACFAVAEGWILAAAICLGVLASNDPDIPRGVDPLDRAIGGNTVADMLVVVALCGVATALRLNHPASRGQNGRVGHTLAVATFFVLGALFLIQAVSLRSVHLLGLLILWKLCAGVYLIVAGYLMSLSMVAATRDADRLNKHIDDITAQHRRETDSAIMQAQALAQSRRGAT